MKTWYIFLIILFGYPFTSSAAKSDLLTQEVALLRKTQIEKVDYAIKFIFSENSDTFKGEARLYFSLKNNSQPLRIDALFNKISKITVNGSQVSNHTIEYGYLLIPYQYLAVGSNIIDIEYETNYSKKNHGLQHFKDPLDQREYIFTDSEPYGAHLFYPCFDQPDLKATFDITMVAPQNWVAISNTPILHQTNEESKKITKFKKSVPISTYLLFVGAGGYHSWTTTHLQMPLTIYARESLAQYVDSDELFKITKKGLDFFNSYFNYSYPFEKYDHIFAPELAPGAMENPGAVTMNERMIFRGPATKGIKFGRTNTLLHEMAHMWFGDLVTMKWWSDVWLNESFATFMAYVAQEQISKEQNETDPWQDFLGIQLWAHWQDGLSTTHPIVTEVSDTEVSRTNFDGITYGKGASTLKQLRFYVGFEPFKKGLQSYFKKYAFQNTDYQDFLNSVGEASRKDLNNWAEGWLKSKGLNRVKVQWNCAQGLINSFSLQMQPTVAGLYLPHKTQVGLFYEEKGQEIKLGKTLHISFQNEVTPIQEALGLKCPSMVHPNLGSHDYSITDLDEISLSKALAHLPRVSDPLTRQLLWSDLYQKVEDLKITASEFISFYSEQIKYENNDSIIDFLLGRSSNIESLYWTVLTPEERIKVAPLMEDSLWNGYQKNISQWEWLDFFIKISNSPSALNQLLDLLNNSSTLDQNRRWEVIKKLSFLGYEKISEIVDNELKRDPSFYGETQAFAINVAFPDIVHKTQAWKQLTQNENGISPSKRKEGYKWFHNPNHPQLSKAFVEPFFGLLEKADWSRNWLMVSVFENLFPGNLCSTDLLNLSETRLKEAIEIPSSGKRYWIEANDELKKCISIRAFNK